MELELGSPTALSLHRGGVLRQRGHAPGMLVRPMAGGVTHKPGTNTGTASITAKSTSTAPSWFGLASATGRRTACARAHPARDKPAADSAQAPQHCPLPYGEAP